MHVALAFYKCCVPWHILVACQLCIKLSMRRTVKCHSLEFAIFVTLIGIEKSKASETVYTCLKTPSTYRNPLSVLTASARPIQDAEADLPMARSSIIGMGTTETFMILPV